MGEQAQRHDAARPDHKAALGIDAHLAVAAQPEGVHRDGLDHGAPAAHHRTVAVQHRAPLLQEGDVGRGAAHVGDDDVALVGERHGADHARRGTGEDRLHRAVQGVGRGDQRAVALDDHQRRVDPELAQPPLDRSDQPVEERR